MITIMSLISVHMWVINAGPCDLAAGIMENVNTKSSCSASVSSRAIKSPLGVDPSSALILFFTHSLPVACQVYTG